MCSLHVFTGVGLFSGCCFLCSLGYSPPSLSTGTSNCLERFVSEMVYNMSSGILNSTHSV